MDPTLTFIASLTSSIIVGSLSSYITFRLQFERHRAMDAEREKHINRWREQVDETLKAHTSRLDDKVTREELAGAYNEMRGERAVMHKQNQEQLERIEAKLELERQEARNDRQLFVDRVTEVALRLAAAGLDEQVRPLRRRPKSRGN